MIRIKPIVEHESYEVNGKEVYKDTNGNWVARQELTPNEVNAFTLHKKNAIDNPEFKKHPEGSYIY